MTTGRKVVIRLLAFLAVILLVLFSGLYATLGLLPAIQYTGVGFILSIATLFLGVWREVEKGLTQRLDYLNQYAFSPLVTECTQIGGWRITPNIEVLSRVIEAIKLNGRYLTLRIYPKQLLELAEAVRTLAKDYDSIWIHLWQQGELWVRTHMNTWQSLGSSFDMGALYFVLGFPAQYSSYPQPKISAVNEFLNWYKREHPEKFSRFTSTHKDLAKLEQDVVSLLNQFMQTNLLRRAR